MQQDSEANYDYLKLLNPQQRAAVEYKDGPALVIAGAGSGKTRVLTYKIVDLLAAGYEPWRILALTFTNKAAREMKERVASVVGEKVAQRLWMGTFHSIFLRILRRHADLLGFNPGFTVYDSNDSRSLIKSIVKNLGLDEKKYKPATIASIISNAKNDLMTPEQYIADNDLRMADVRATRPETGKIFKIYCQRCRAASAMDFDDILYFMNVLLRDHPDIRRHYQEFFRYILVDEYQDTNFAQHLVISQLAEQRRMLCVVGDDAQSIYSFRGANIRNILTLEKQFPGLEVFKLERNYRSTQNIINAAGSLITRNTRQMPKNVYSENAVGEKVNVIQTYSDYEEAALVANRISESILSRHDKYSDYAILYRTNAQSRALEEALRKRNIPYRIYGGLSFYQRKEVKDAVCYFRAAVNPSDDEAVRRIINYPARGIGETTMKKLTEAAIARQVSIFTVASDPAQYGATVNAGTRKKLELFTAMIQDFHEKSQVLDAEKLANVIYSKTGILTQFISDTTPESISRQENLTELLGGVKEFVDTRVEEGNEATDMNSFLNDVFLATDFDSSDDNSEEKVMLMTVHASKGLEFEHVIITGVEEELFPSAMSMDTIDQIEEERRLLYVAITRAKTTCTLTYAGTRFRNGQTIMTRPSRFITEMDRKYLQVKASSGLDFGEKFTNPAANYYKDQWKSRPEKPRGRQPQFRAQQSGGGISLSSLTAAPSSTPKSNGNEGTHAASEVSEGMRIYHPKFGKGTIESVTNRDGQSVITVNFDNTGVKRLMLKFAKFDILQS